MDIFDTGSFQEGKRSVQSVDTRDVLGTGFKFIRQKVRLHLRVGNAAGTAGDQRDHLLRNLIANQKSADSLWTQQAFVSGEGEHINVHLFHVDREGTRCLCRIQNKGQSVLFAQLSHLLDRHQGATNVGGVQHQYRLGVWTNHSLHLVDEQLALLVAGDAVKLYALLKHLGQRAHHGIVLHCGNQDMVSRAQVSFYNIVEGVGDAWSKDHVFDLIKMEHIAQHLSGFDDNILRRIGCLIAAAVDIGTDVFDKIKHRLSYARRLWIRCASVVQIYPFHDPSPSSDLLGSNCPNRHFGSKGQFPSFTLYHLFRFVPPLFINSIHLYNIIEKNYFSFLFICYKLFTKA